MRPSERRASERRGHLLAWLSHHPGVTVETIVAFAWQPAPLVSETCIYAMRQRPMCRADLRWLEAERKVQRLGGTRALRWVVTGR